MSGDAATTALVAMQGLERVFAIGIGPTIAVAAGVKAFEVLHDQIKKTDAAYKDLKDTLDTLEKPVLDPEVKKSQDQIDDLTKKVKTLGDESVSFSTKFGRSFTAAAGVIGNIFLPAFLRGPVTAGLSAAAPTGQSAINQQIDRAGKAIELLSNRREAKFYQSLDRLSDAIQKTADKVQSPFRNLFEDIGSGQFARDFMAKRAENARIQQGQGFVAEMDAWEKSGHTLDPISKAAVEAARKAGAAGGFSLSDLAHTDFSNMDQLSKYDFSGLAPLSGMTLIVK